MPGNGTLSVCIGSLAFVDVDWAVEQLRDFLYLHERVPLPPEQVTPNRKTRIRGSEEERSNATTLARLISSTIYAEPLRHIGVDSIRRMIWELTEGDAARDRLGLLEDGSPTIHVDAMHPWVWEAARPHWMADNHSAAVWAASVNVNSRLQQKVDRRDIGEGKLIAECFSVSMPEPGRPRLRRCDESNPDLFKDMHSGAISLGRGLYSAVRNPLAHGPEADHHAGEVEHLEALAGFSLLARWIDTADVITTD